MNGKTSVIEGPGRSGSILMSGILYKSTSDDGVDGKGPAWTAHFSVSDLCSLRIYHLHLRTRLHTFVLIIFDADAPWACFVFKSRNKRGMLKLHSGPAFVLQFQCNMSTF